MTPGLFSENTECKSRNKSQIAESNKIISSKTHSTSYDLICSPKPWHKPTTCHFTHRISLLLKHPLSTNPRCWTSTVSFCVIDGFVTETKWSSPMGWSFIAFSGCPFSKIIRQVFPTPREVVLHASRFQRGFPFGNGDWGGELTHSWEMENNESERNT